MNTSKAFRFITLLRKSKKGAAAAEYALILAIIGSVLAVAAVALGGAIGGAIQDTTACINGSDPTCVPAVPPTTP